MRALPPNGTRVRAKVRDWAICQANNLEKYPDPRLPTLEGIPEWVEGPLNVRRTETSWGQRDEITIEFEDTVLDVEPDSLLELGSKTPTPPRRSRRTGDHG
jgi:hypothetical protein